ncbi:MAG: hypothetical protein J5701_05225 [Bacteroidales bacterium]|nr:hypothetical protein [Bacteroidales bacterium]
MKRNFVLVCLLVGLFTITSAQKWVGTQHTLSASMGWSTMLGELGGGPGIGTYGLKDFDFQAMSPVYTLGYTYTKDKGNAVGFSFKLDASYTRMNSCDNYTENESRNRRQVSRITDLVELYAGVEFYFLKQTMSAFRVGAFNHKGFKSRSVRSGIPLSMYLILGAGGVWYDCKGKYSDGEWYSLRELHTEGQGLLNTRKQPAPVQAVGVLGLGIKRLFTPSFAMKIEAGMRLTSTDYLDEVSTTYLSPDAIYDAVLAETNDAEKADRAKYFADGTRLDASLTPGQIRGNALKNDAYFFVQLGFCYVMQGKKNPLRNSFK